MNVSAFATLLTIFAFIALVLASVGLYAVVAHSISQRTQEIGVRMALVGVSPGDPITFLAVILILGAVGVLGCVIPARRAIRVDPLVALRCD